MAFIDQWNKKHGDSKRGLVLGASPTGDLSLYDRWVLSQNPKLKNKIIQHYAVRNGLKEEEAAKLQAQQAEAEKKQAYNESFVGRAKGVANKVSDVGEALYKGVASDFTTLGTGVGTAVGQSGGDVAKAQQAQTSTIDRNLKLLEQVNAQLKDPKTPGAKKIRLQKVAKMLNEQTQQLTSTQTADAQKTLDATIPSKNVGALVNVGMLASGGVLARSVGVGEGLKAAEMTGQQILRNALVGASEGAIGGVATGVQKDGYTQNDLLKSGGIGAGIGGAIPLLATGIGKEVSHFRGGNKVAAEAPQVSQEAVATITDNQHILPEHAGTGTIEPFKNLATIDARDPALAVLQKGADPKNIKRLKVVEKKIAQAQQVGGVTPDQAHSLLNERAQLLESIRNPQTPVAKAIREVDTKLSTATSKNEAASLTKEKTFLQEQALADARAQNIADDLSPTSIADTTSVDGVPVYGKSKLTPNQQSLKTEALAVKNGITEVAGDPTLTPSGTYEQWTTKVLATMNSNYDEAKKIAAGLAPPPEGVPPNAFYRGVEARAIREKDGATLKMLLDGNLGQVSKAQGQNIAALAMKNPDSPVDAMKLISAARKKSSLNIPKTILPEEAQTLTDMANKVAIAREAVANGGDRFAYGKASVEMSDYVNSLVEQAGKKTLKETLSKPGTAIVDVAGVSKSLRATLDNSGLLRQGWKTMLTHPKTWAKNSIKSFEDLVRAFGDRNVLSEIHADTISRPNAMNGLYKRMGLDVLGVTEEAFPSAFPEKIPVFRRFYNASDAAYTGFLQRSRADLADKYLEIAQKSGVDLTSKRELQSIGKLVNSLTSRGHLGPAGEKASKALNNIFFSPRMLKSNVDILTAHQFQGGVTPFVRKRAALNLLKIASGTAAILKVADAIKPGSVEWDPRSSNFGKIRVGDTRFDVAGGLAGLVTLGSRIAPAIPGVPGEPATKSSTTGDIKQLNTGEFGSQTTVDVISNFFENKTAPAVSVMRDLLKGQDFNGNKPTIGSTIANLTEPLIITNYRELKSNPRAANVLAGMIAEGLGVSTNTYSINANWETAPGKGLQEFKKTVGPNKFKQANTKYNEEFSKWFDSISKTSEYNKLSIEDRRDLLANKRAALKDDVLASYGFKYKYQQKPENTKKLINDLKNIK